MSSADIVKFTKIRSATDPSFWAKFAELKIDRYKLDEKSKISLWANYNLEYCKNSEKINPLVLDYTSFNETPETDLHSNSTVVVSSGVMVNLNTFESFRRINPEEFIDSMGRHLVETIESGDALKDPWKLSFFILLSYSDLKKYRFHYWMAYPTPFGLPELCYVRMPNALSSIFAPTQIQSLESSFLKMDGKRKSFFAVVINSSKEQLEVIELSRCIERLKKSDTSSSVIHLAFYDPCETKEPGWPLRNLLCLLFCHCPEIAFKENINVISIRGSDIGRSLAFTIKVKKELSSEKEFEEARRNIFQGRFVGWEANANGKMGPNIADLSSTMDPAKMSENASNLNLKLMKWRLVPDLNLDKISDLRCLLLGAGTLGCSVARILLGWGITNITFVDGSNVSHSNTVRQSLYTHEDAVQRRYKAQAAKDALLRIRPTLNVDGVVLQIPMPGHVLGNSTMESTRKSFEKLQQLVDQNDVVFLLLDSREARWLPTVLCAAKDKIAINAALGFDSYTVQRHGTRNSFNGGLSSPDLTLLNPTGKDLGCYFCNDVTQPGNSQVDRTLDQQCTVSRPGLSQIAAGLAVELMVSITQHSDGIEAKALLDYSINDSESSDPTDRSMGLLGGVPHTIRGSLWTYENKLTITHRFPSCTACSFPIVNEYRSQGFSFLVNACNEPNYLEKLSGLEELLKRPGLDELCYAIDSSSEEDNDKE